MEGRNLRAIVMMSCVILGVVAGQSNGSFRDCYAKCFLFCMIEPSENLCSCTAHCLKDCIFSDTPQDSNVAASAADHSFGFCKLGCAYSSCFNITTKHHPNEKEVENCVGSCSKKCTENYLSP